MIHSELEEAAISYARAVNAHHRVLTKIDQMEDSGEKDEDLALTEKALQLEGAVEQAQAKLLGTALQVGNTLGILRG